MKKSSILVSFSGALVAASLALAGPAAAAGHGHGPVAPGHDVSAAPAVQSSGGFTPDGVMSGRLDGLSNGLGTAELPIGPVGGSQAAVGSLRPVAVAPPAAATLGISTPAPAA